MPEYQLAVFDIAGTTVYDGDAVHTCLIQSLVTIAGKQFSRAQVNAVMGIRKDHAIAELLRADSGISPDANLIANCLSDFEQRIVNFYRTDSRVAPVPGAERTFEELKSRGIRVALDTGFSANVVSPLMDRLGWVNRGVVDAWIASDQVTQGRPAPFMIFRLMEKFGVTDVSKVIKIGDTPSDLLEGANARCGLTIGVTEGSHTTEELAAFPHDHLIGSVADLPRLLDSLSE